MSLSLPLNRAVLAEAFSGTNRQHASQLSHICPGIVSIQQHSFKLYP
jgi:hypothetical protein